MDEKDLDLFTQLSLPDASANIEGGYADCLLGFVGSSGFDQNATVDISMDCKVGQVSGSSAGVDEVFYNLLMPHFHGHPSGLMVWEQDRAEYCSMLTANNARYPGHGPTTLTIVINCWWENEATILNATVDDRPVEDLIADAAHGILGVVTQIDAVPYNATANNGTESVRETVFTEVDLVVNEDLRGTYNATLMTLRFEGGTVDNLRVISPEAPQFELGEYVFVLVGEPDEDGYYSIIGQINGKYVISGDGARTDHYERFTTIDELRALFADEQP